jgi:hypothetical protein
LELFNIVVVVILAELDGNPSWGSGKLLAIVQDWTR